MSPAFKQRINNGDRVKDPISGFSGIVTARIDYLNGCTRIGVTSEKLSDGKPIEAQFFDEPQLVIVKRGIHFGINETGGDKPNPPARNENRR